MRIIARFLSWFGVPAGIMILGLGFTLPFSGLRVLVWIGAGVIFCLGVLFDYWYLRPNQSRVVSELNIETWDAVDDGQHNSNTDMIYWQESFYLVHAAAPFHFASQKCRLILHRSQDARHWDKVAEFHSEAEDIRDPKLTPIGDRLYLYALTNRSFNPEPYTTVYASSGDGTQWTTFEKIQPEDWLFWRPKSWDGKVWFVPAYWWEHGKSALFRSENGYEWSLVSSIYEGDRNDETAIEFLSEGKMIATARLEYSANIFGDRRGATLISTAEPPYIAWKPLLKSRVTRLDGPCLFRYKDRIFTVGRYQPGLNAPPCRQGSVFARKRTALFEIRQDGLVYLTDLPSAGDTSYPGVVVQEEYAIICYYSSDSRRDYPWIIGMMEASAIKMARVNLNLLVEYSDRIRAK